MRAVRPLLAAMSLCACGPGLDEPGQTPGSLGNGYFYFDCTSVNDPSCPNPPVQGQLAFPSSVAFGSTFKLTYSPAASPNSTDTPVYPVSSDFFGTVSVGTFTALRVGTSWFVASGGVGSILDMLSLHVAPIGSVAILEPGTTYLSCWGPCPAPVPDVMGTTHTFVAAARDSSGQSLAGDVLYSWASSDPTVVAILDDHPFPSDSVDVFYAGAGTATLYAWTSTALGSTTITVKGASEIAITAGDAGGDP